MSLDLSESTSDTSFDVSFVICAYTEQRWDELLAAVRSVQGQSVAAREIIVVIDNNPALLARVREALPDVIAEENSGGRGAGQARNRAVGLASGSTTGVLGSVRGGTRGG